MLALAGGDHLAVGGNDLGGEEAINSEAVLADHEADTAAEREAAETDGGGIAGRKTEAVLGGE